MRSIRCLGLAGAAMVLVLSAGAAVAAPATTKDLPASSSCPVPPYGAQFYAPSYPGYAKTVALTFDDGPGKTTDQILRILHAYHAPATFFNIGQNMAARPAGLRKEKRYGFVLGNHTWSHSDLTRLTRRQQEAQIGEATAEQRSITGITACVFRPPYGSYNATTLSVARDHRLAVWLWSVDTEDWKADGSASAYWVHRIIRLAEEEGIELQHPVVIMHNQPAGNPATALALPTIIRFFRHHHYRLVLLTS